MEQRETLKADKDKYEMFSSILECGGDLWNKAKDRQC